MNDSHACAVCVQSCTHVYSEAQGEEQGIFHSVDWGLCLLLLLLLLLSNFSRVRLCATPETAAHEAPPSLGFSRQEHWSALPFPSPCMKVKSESEVAQSCLTLSDPMDCSLPSSSIHGICQARVLEWVAITFSAQLHSFHILAR